ncbi:melanoma-associated antigen D2 [Stomoxys calcitrans]|uniref:melanoma-associated antigen D2 n=1 Tax=Stomoxys calcitrans TaxID=35570 RepID=UPI0027E295C6|nr:melanoma-associated antigen D2 [Stomoxys calcitrans]
MESSFAVDEIASCTNSIITYIINGISNKLPIKERDITTVLNVKGRLFNMALTQAKTALQETFGIVMVDVPDSKSGKAIICYNEDSGKSVLLFDGEQQRQLTLLFVLLSYLFMRGSDAPQNNNTSEEDLVNFLNGIRIHFDAPHEYFGDNIKKLITETFVKQLYLKREKVVSEMESEVKFYYSWGFRAHMEFDKKMVLEATAKILKKPPSFFVAKYQEVHQEDKQMET